MGREMKLVDVKGLRKGEGTGSTEQVRRALVQLIRGSRTRQLAYSAKAALQARFQPPLWLPPDLSAVNDWPEPVV